MWNEIQRNHIYIGEARAPTFTVQNAVCEKYGQDESAYDDVFGSERYFWNAEVRKTAKRDGATVLYGTAYAQRAIWAHQHPVDCNSARFLTLLHWPMGIGALLHFLGRALAVAMELGRILILSVENFDPPTATMGMPWYDATFCPGRISWECWFQSLAGCGAEEDSDVKVIQVELLGRFRPGALVGRGNFTRHYVPHLFEEMLRECSNVKPGLYFYWWQAQSVTYFVRFNRATRDRLDRMRSKLLFSQLQGSQVGVKAKKLPPGTVAMHVRHGDKAIEMALQPFSRYLREANRLAAGVQRIPVHKTLLSTSTSTFQFAAAAFASKRLFISTENPEVIFQALQAPPPEELHHSKAAAWQVFFSRENRTNADVHDMRLQRGSGRATLESFLNLELALEADAWVCTLFSNWCQLIDELRMTVAGKAAWPYINVETSHGFRPGGRCPAYDRDCYIFFR